MSCEESDFSLKLHAIDHHMKPCRFMQDLANQTAISQSLKNDVDIQNRSREGHRGRDSSKRRSEQMAYFQNLQENLGKRSSVC